MSLAAAHEVAFAAVLALAVGVLLLFAFLLLQREIGTLVARHRTRREAALTPLVHQALGHPAAVGRLRAALRPFDRAVIREMLLHLALDLRGEEAARIARLFRDLGLLEVELGRLTSWRRRRRSVAAENLGTLQIPGTFRALLLALEDHDVHVRIAVVRALGDLQTPEALVALVSMLGDASPSVSRQAQDILAERGRTVAREIRAYIRRGGSRRGRLAAVELLGWHRAPEAATLLLELMAEEDLEVRVKAVKAASAIGDPRFLEPFHALVSDPSWEVRCHAARGLGLLGSQASVALLRPLLGDRHWWVRYHAGSALAELGAQGRSALEDACVDPDGRTHEMARYILERAVVPVLP